MLKSNPQYHGILCYEKIQREKWSSTNQEGASHQTLSFQHLDLRPPKPPQLQEINCCLRHSVYGSLLQQPQLTKILGKFTCFTCVSTQEKGVTSC